jgi:hypothetical protein
VVDYGRLEVASEDLGVEQGIMVALREFKELVLAGWARDGATTEQPRVLPEQVWVDAGYQTNVVYAFCRESGDRFRPAVGRGAAQRKGEQTMDKASQTGSVVKLVGEAYHAAWLPVEKLYLLEVDADHWKTWVHQRLATPVGGPGAMTLHHAKEPQQQHLSFVKHLTAESKVEEFVAGKGVVVRWERIRRQNHWLDALYNACCAAHLAGVRLVVEQPKPPRRRRIRTTTRSSPSGGWTGSGCGSNPWPPRAASPAHVAFSAITSGSVGSPSPIVSMRAAATLSTRRLRAPYSVSFLEEFVICFCTRRSLS